MTPTLWTRPHLTDPRIAVLSRRQEQVLDGLCHGLTNAAISRRLFITESSVKTHLKRVYRLLDARDRAHAAALAMSGQVTVYVRDGQERRAA